MYLFWLRWVFAAVHGLFSSCGKQGLLCLGAQASHRRGLPRRLEECSREKLRHPGSVAVAAGSRALAQQLRPGLSCSETCGSFLDQGLKPQLLPLQADS